MRKQWNSKQRFSLRKFSTGLASVLLATMFMSQGTLVHADEAGTTADNKEEVVQPKKDTSNETTVQPKATENVEDGKALAPEQPVVSPEQPQPITSLGKEKEKIEEPKVDFNTTKLEALIKEVEGLNLEKYTEESVKELNVRLAKAKEVLVNAKSQKEIDSTYNALVGYKNSGLKRVPKLEENNTSKPDTTNGNETVGKKAENTEPNGTNIAGHNHSLNGTTRSEGSGFRDAGQPELTDVTMGLWSGTKYYSNNIYVTEPGSNVKNNNIKVKVKSASDPITELTVTGNDGFTPVVKKSGLGTTEADLYFEGTTPNSGGWAMTVTAKTAKGKKEYNFGVYYTFKKPTIEKPTEKPDGISEADYNKMTLEDYLKGKANSKPTLNVTVPSAPPMPANAKMKVYLVHGGTEYRFDGINAYPEGFNIIAKKEVTPGNTTVKIESKDYDKNLIAGKIKALTVIELNGKTPDGKPDERGSYYSSEVPVTAPAPEVDKSGAIQAIDDEVTKQNGVIEGNNGLTSEEKTSLKQAVSNAATKAKAEINKEGTNTDAKVTEEKNKGITAIRGAATKTKTNKELAVKAIDDEVNKQNGVIDGKSGLTSDEVTALKKAVSDAATTAKENINKAETNTDVLVEKAKNDGITAIQFVIVKEMAKHSLEEAARREKAEITSDKKPDLTDAVRNNELGEVDRVLKSELDKIDSSTTTDAVKESTKQGVKVIEAIHKPLSSNAVEAAVLTLPELDLQTALVAGTATVKQGQELTDDDIKKQLTLPEEKVLSVLKPSTDKVGNFVATVKLLLGKTEVTVNVPVSIYSQTPPKVDDLSKAKEEAIEKVEKAVKDKLQEIEKQADLTEVERKAAKNEVNKAKDSAWEAIAQASSLGTVELLGEEYAKNIAAFTSEHGKDILEVKAPDVSELDKAKAEGIAAVLQAEVDKLELMKKDTALTPSEKVEVKSEIARIRSKAIADIRREKDVTSVQTITDAAVKAILNARPRYNYHSNDNANHSSTTNTNHSQSDNDMMKALLAKKEEAKMLIEQEAMKKKAEISQAELSGSEKALLDARVDQEKAKAFQMIDQATTIEEVNQVLKAGIEAIRSIAVASANGRMTDVTPEESEAAMAQAHRQALPQTGTGNEVAIFGAAASAILAGLGLVVPSKKKED